MYKKSELGIRLNNVKLSSKHLRTLCVLWGFVVAAAVVVIIVVLGVG